MLSKLWGRNYKFFFKVFILFFGFMVFILIVFNDEVVINVSEINVFFWEKKI